MTHKPPSQIYISLLATGSLIAGILASSLFGEREAVKRDKPVLLIEQSLASDSP